MDPTAKAISDARSEMSPDEMEKLAEQICTYHAPDGTQQAQIGEVRQATRNLIVAILKHCPRSDDRTAALRKAREAMMTANASIVLKGQSIS